MSPHLVAQQVSPTSQALIQRDGYQFTARCRLRVSQR
ncbi:hypothetical protein LMG22037_03446 [Paraburkholderia phenoliruptrix]|uniref:Uncharacterized protein n=1 Tax=Paraburkholderia phenoliruptrix TaxID=252970 RepID=A0A6J5BC76_9BURK|nr:hypothetical protein LMG22037_03446 [Paraburkholderia phenoliruptrix]